MTVDPYMCDAHTQAQTSSHTHRNTTHLQHTYTIYKTDPPLPAYPFPLFSVYNARTNTTTHAHPTPTYDAPFTTPLLPPPPTHTHKHARTHTIVSCHSMSVLVSQQRFILFQCQSIVTAPNPDKFSNSSENKDAQLPALSGATDLW